MSKVSIIIPCLNVANYIEHCVESVLGQTLQDIEILVIDAGSTDGTLEKLKKYSVIDKRLHIIFSDKKSYGYQVNIGIEKAAGIYIGIVDADDEIVEDMYEELYRNALETDADYVKGTAKLFYTLCNGERYEYPVRPFAPKEIGCKIEIAPKETPYLLARDNFLWYGIYKSTFLKQIRLHESPGAAFQDLGALFQIQTRAKKAVYISKPVYYYRQDNVNASTYNPKAFRFIADEYAFAEQFLQGLSAEWHTAFYRKLFLHFMDRMYAMAALGNFWEDTLPEMQSIVKILREKNVEGIFTKKDLTQKQWDDLRLLWEPEGPYHVFEKYRKIYVKGECELKNISNHLRNRQGVIFGSGNFGTFIHAQLLYRGCKNIVAYCDNNVKVQGDYLYNVEILSPNQAVQKYPQAKYIVASKYCAGKMQEQLELLGIEAEDILTYSFGTDRLLFGAMLC